MVTACCVNNTLYNKHKYQHKWLSLAVAQTVVDGHILKCRNENKVNIQQEKCLTTKAMFYVT